jgi:Skp family chaperone for outer membrane proteins
MRYTCVLKSVVIATQLLEMPMSAVLVVDLAALLDTSKVGIEATKDLEKQWEAAKKLNDAERPVQFAKIQAKRDALRDALLARAKPLVADLARDKKADLVLDRSAVLWGKTEDVTAVLIAKVDALGAIKA